MLYLIYRKNKNPVEKEKRGNICADDLIEAKIAVEPKNGVEIPR